MSSPVHLNPRKYRGYAGLPPLVGLASMEDAVKGGLSVEQSVARLKRLHWGMRTAFDTLIARIASEPVYELKMAYSLHAHYCAEHISSVAGRIREMRQPPYELEEPPAAPLLLLKQEILAAPSTQAFLLGLYAVLFPAIQHGFEALLAATHPLFDHPTTRLCRFAALEFAEVNAYGSMAVDALVPQELASSLQSGTRLLSQALRAAGGLDGAAEESNETLEPVYSQQPLPYDARPRRDERFQDPFNMGVNAEAMLFDPSIAPLPKTLMLFFKRMREIDVPEMMSSILVQAEGKPWNYFRDMARQLWDEARHAMMGEIGFVSLGIDWTDIPFNFTWALDLNTKLTPLERHAVLYTIEQGLMPKKNGKEYEWQVAVATANPLAALIQDYDWADEILHARIGRDWLVPELGSQQQALAFGDQAWSRTAEDWAKWRTDGLTKHRNWWPDVYRQACAAWGIAPDERLLTFNTTYENTRADQKQIRD